jgi:hypothetical protein
MNFTGEAFADNFCDIDNTSNNCDDACKSNIWGFWIEGVAFPCIALFGIFG